MSHTTLRNSSGSFKSLKFRGATCPRQSFRRSRANLGYRLDRGRTSSYVQKVFPTLTRGRIVTNAGSENYATEKEASQMGHNGEATLEHKRILERIPILKLPAEKLEPCLEAMKTSRSELRSDIL